MSTEYKKLKVISANYNKYPIDNIYIGDYELVDTETFKKYSWRVKIVDNRYFFVENDVVDALVEGDFIIVARLAYHK